MGTTISHRFQIDFTTTSHQFHIQFHSDFTFNFTFNFTSISQSHRAERGEFFHLCIGHRAPAAHRAPGTGHIDFTTLPRGARRNFSLEHRAPDTGRTPGTGHRAPGTGHRAPGTGHRAPGTGTGHRAPGTGHRPHTGRATARHDGTVHFAPVSPSLGRKSPHSLSHAASPRPHTCHAQHTAQEPKTKSIS